MKRSPKIFPQIAAGLLVLACAVSPLLAADESATPDPTNGPVGLAFRWLNFALVAGAIIYLVRKFMAPYFRGAAEGISETIHEATDARTQAQQELQEAERSLASLNAEIEQMRRTAAADAAAEAERLRALAKSESEKIARAAQAEIAAAERAGRQELRAIAARLAVQQAAALVRAQMTPGADAALFQSFLANLERNAR